MPFRPLDEALPGELDLEGWDSDDDRVPVSLSRRVQIDHGWTEREILWRTLPIPFSSFSPGLGRGISMSQGRRFFEIFNIYFFLF